MKAPFVFTVSELTRHIKSALEPQYTDIWVEGEISNLKIPSSGHSYFTLKDAGSQIRTVMFRFQNRLLRFKPDDGLKVMCRGSINVYEPRGEYQLVVEIMEPKGIGALQLAFEQLKKKLQEEGLFDRDKKKPLPFLPRSIGVITSPTGAAVRDIITILHRRFPNREIIIIPVKVQGDDAPDEIVHALAMANDAHIADVLIVGRGGGSLEDLWAFNTEKVARAIFSSKIPTISAVGHETDFTIADFVADVRAPT
ncbi:MAG: exodeoxyribonuclease VII large subunit, partial [Pseudomonadota bacterium]